MNADVEELVHMLPTTGEPVLPPMRHRQLKDHFVREMARSRRRPRIRVVALLVPAAAAAAAAALVLVVQPSGHGRTEEVSSTTPGIVHVPHATTTGVAETLGRIADAAARQPAVTIGADQYTYTRSMVSSSRPVRQRTLDGPVESISLHQRQTWIPQNVSEDGLIRENGDDTTLHLDKGDLNYRQLAALPTDPAALLNRLYIRQGDRDPARAFDQIEGLLTESIVPPRTRAALYRATALIPGVRVVSDSVDGLGHKGVAVAFEANGERSEWIFDKTSFAYLGDRDYLIADSTRGKAGTLMSTGAVVTQKAVDEVGDLG